MKMASIVPQNYLDMTAESDFHMALAHLVGKAGFEKYTAFFTNRKKGSFCILDNGVVEGEPMTIADVVDRAILIHADEIILPDVLKDAEATMRDTMNALDYLKERFGSLDALPFKLMVVPQGRDEEDWLQCAKYMVRNLPIHTIGIPKHLNETCGRRDGRLYAISDLGDLVGAELTNNSIEIHLLGCATTPLEVLTIAKASEQGIIPEVRSCDSAIPYVYARNNLKFSDSDRPDKEPIDFKLGCCNEMLLAYNILAWNFVGDPSAERSVWFI